MKQILNVDYKEWAAMYGLRIKEHTCRSCKRAYLATIPVADKGMRGLQIPDHGCDPGYNACHFIFVDKELENKLLNAIKDF